MAAMSNRPKQARRLSIFGIGTAHPLSSSEQTPEPSASVASIVFPSKQADQEDASSKAQNGRIRRKLSKKRKSQPNTQPNPDSSSQATSYNLYSTQLSELSHESSVPCSIQQKPPLQRKTSMSVRTAFASFFVPKPSRKTVVGILDGMEGISGGKSNDKRKAGERTTYYYESRSPTPPSPEIRPPSGLGQINSSVDLSTYIQEEHEASLLSSLSRRTSIVPSVILSFPLTPSEDATVTATPATTSTKSLKSRESDAELFYQPSSLPPTEPSQALIKALDLSMVHFSPGGLCSLARTRSEFLHSARLALYSSIDSDTLEDEKRKRTLLQTLASSPALGSIVKSLRWVCSPVPPSPSPSSLIPKRSIPRRAPTVSFSSSPEEYVLPRILPMLSNLETLALLQPHSFVLESFLSVCESPQRSPSASPVLSPQQLFTPSLLSLKSLTLAGRTTLSTSFGAVLVRFLELHPGIQELHLPDVFCLPHVLGLLRHNSGSSSSSSPISTHGSEIPPVPPFPPSLVSLKGKEPSAPPLLPNLARLTAPVSLASQLVPGRPLRSVDIELTTSMYDGLRPADIVRTLAEARYVFAKRDGEAAKHANWRAARMSRRFGANNAEQAQTAPSSSDDTGKTSWKAARQARRAGNNYSAKPIQSLRELRLRCTAKVDGRTIGRILNALGAELGSVLEVLAIGWSGREAELHSHLTPTLSRFSCLQRLEIFNSLVYDYEDADDEKSESELHVGIALEQKLVEQWSRMCPELSYIEFASGRVWKSS